MHFARGIEFWQALQKKTQGPQWAAKVGEQLSVGIIHTEPCPVAQQVGNQTKAKPFQENEKLNILQTFPASVSPYGTNHFATHSVIRFCAAGIAGQGPTGLLLYVWQAANPRTRPDPVYSLQVDMQWPHDNSKQTTTAASGILGSLCIYMWWKTALVYINYWHVISHVNGKFHMLSLQNQSSD